MWCWTQHGPLLNMRVSFYISHLLLHSWIINGADIPGMAVSSLFLIMLDQWTASRTRWGWDQTARRVREKDKSVNISGHVCACKQQHRCQPCLWLRGHSGNCLQRHTLNTFPGDHDLPLLSMYCCLSFCAYSEAQTGFLTVTWSLRP